MCPAFSLLPGLFIKRLNITWLSQHLVDLVKMLLFEQDHLTSILLKRDIFAVADLKKLLVRGKRRLFLLEALAQNIADVVLMGFEQTTDLQTWVTPEPGH